jgi:GNS1/SUR4 family
MQISQFLIGITFASMHLFVHYTVPVSTPYAWTKTVSSVVSAASAAVAHAAHEVGNQAQAAAESPGIALFLKQLLLRAIGEAGMAKKLGQDANQKPTFIPPQSSVNITETIQRETKWRTQYEFIPCIDTEGQAFAIWLNVFYLAPLT